MDAQTFGGEWWFGVKPGPPLKLFKPHAQRAAAARIYISRGPVTGGFTAQQPATAAGYPDYPRSRTLHFLVARLAHTARLHGKGKLRQQSTPAQMVKCSLLFLCLGIVHNLETRTRFKDIEYFVVAGAGADGSIQTGGIRITLQPARPIGATAHDPRRAGLLGGDHTGPLSGMT